MCLLLYQVDLVDPVMWATHAPARLYICLRGEAKAEAVSKTVSLYIIKFSQFYIVSYM